MKQSSKSPSMKRWREALDTASSASFTIKENDHHFIGNLAKLPQPSRQLTIITMSHAESMNLIFPNWLRLCHQRGAMEYKPYDMNMPATIVPRKSSHYRFDDPLTERGQIVAQTYGRGMASAGIQPFEVYCSPDMKSVQTAHFLIKGLETSFTSICIEPALMHYRRMLPPNISEIFLSPKAYAGLGFPINLDYVPLKKISISETIEDYNERVNEFFSRRISKIEQKHVIVISNNCVVEMLNNTKIETIDDILNCTKKPSCQFSTIRLKPKEVKLIDNQILPFTRSLYHAKPQIWSDYPIKLTLPNHPDIEKIRSKS